MVARAMDAAALLEVENAVRPRVLNVGAGSQILSEWEKNGAEVIKLDIEPRTNPDICADMCDMGEIGQFEAVFCCHAVEHLYPHQVPLAIGEFFRVLKDGGVAMVMVPDLEDVVPDETVLGMAESGPITGLHLFYGDARLIPDQPYMAHHSGFIASTLQKVMEAAGFSQTMVKRLPGYNLLAVGKKSCESK